MVVGARTYTVAVAQSTRLISPRAWLTVVKGPGEGTAISLIRPITVGRPAISSLIERVAKPPLLSASLGAVDAPSRPLRESLSISSPVTVGRSMWQTTTCLTPMRCLRLAKCGLAAKRRFACKVAVGVIAPRARVTRPAMRLPRLQV